MPNVPYSWLPIVCCSAHEPVHYFIWVCLDCCHDAVRLEKSTKGRVLHLTLNTKLLQKGILHINKTRAYPESHKAYEIPFQVMITNER